MAWWNRARKTTQIQGQILDDVPEFEDDPGPQVPPELDWLGSVTETEHRARYDSGAEPRTAVEAAWFWYFQGDPDEVALHSGFADDHRTPESAVRERAGKRAWRERRKDRHGTPAILPHSIEPDRGQGADPAATADEIPEIRRQFNAGEPAPDTYDAGDVAIWRAARARRQKEATDWWESRGGVPKDVWATEREDPWEEQPEREAQQAAAARLGEALTHAERARAAYAAAQPAEHAAPDGSIAQGEARAARLAAKEAQFYADLEVMDAQATFQWIQRAYSAPSPWLAAASPDERNAQDAVMAAEQAASGSAGLTGQHHRHGHPAQEQPAGMTHQSPETAATSEPAGSGADSQPAAADPAEPEHTGQAPVAPQRHAQDFPSHDHAGASPPGPFAASGREPAAPSRPGCQSAYAADDLRRQGQAYPEADFEAGS